MEEERWKRRDGIDEKRRE
jgi:hypothetical protein